MNEFMKGSLIFAGGAIVGYTLGTVDTFIKTVTSIAKECRVDLDIKEKWKRVRDICFDTRDEAEGVIDAILDICSDYGCITVADIFELCGLPSEYTDCKYGWESVRGIYVFGDAGHYRIHFNLPVRLD